MRLKEQLKDLGDIGTLLKYLYMDEDNYIIVNNGMANIKIQMDCNYNFLAYNLNFNNLPAMNYNEEMTVPTMLGCIDYLKTQNSCNEHFNGNRWEEIVFHVGSTMSLTFNRSK